jgi:hypothetical protein
MPEPTLRLSIPPEGLRRGGVVLRLPVDALVPAFADPELREAANLPEFSANSSSPRFPSCRCSSSAAG